MDVVFDRVDWLVLVDVALASAVDVVTDVDVVPVAFDDALLVLVGAVDVDVTDVAFDDDLVVLMDAVDGDVMDVAFDDALLVLVDVDVARDIDVTDVAFIDAAVDWPVLDMTVVALVRVLMLVEVDVGAAATITPVMPVWMVQWYGKVPGKLNVALYDSGCALSVNKCHQIMHLWINRRLACA